MCMAFVVLPLTPDSGVARAPRFSWEEIKYHEDGNHESRMHQRTSVHEGLLVTLARTANCESHSRAALAGCHWRPLRRG